MNPYLFTCLKTPVIKMASVIHLTKYLIYLYHQEDYMVSLVLQTIQSSTQNMWTKAVDSSPCDMAEAINMYQDDYIPKATELRCNQGPLFVFNYTTCETYMSHKYIWSNARKSKRGR